MEVKRLKKLTFLFIIGFSWWLVGCSQDERIEKLQRFIATQVDCATYKNTGGDEKKIKEAFSEFFTEESYQKYLDDVVGYMYPQLYYLTNAEQVKIKSIICKKVKEKPDKLRTYTFEVAYIIIPAKTERKKNKPISMKDQTQVTINENNQITEVVLLNTGDIISKLFLDIKVQ